MAEFNEEPLKNRWVLLINGILLLLLTIITIISIFNIDTSSSLRLLYSIIMAISGCFSIFLFFKKIVTQKRFLVLINGIIDILFALLVFSQPESFTIILAMVIGIIITIDQLILLS